MPIVRPGGPRAFTPRVGLIKCGHRGPKGFPVAVPHIVTRYIIPKGKLPPEEVQNGAIIRDCRIVGEDNDSADTIFSVIHCNGARVAEKRAELKEALDYGSHDAKIEMASWEPWEFRFTKEEGKRAEGYRGGREDLVTVIRRPEIELEYGINPKSVKITLPGNEQGREERAKLAESIGADPDFNCYQEKMLLWDPKRGCAFCTGNGVRARRKLQNGDIVSVACEPFDTIPDGEGNSRPNMNVCEFRGRWVDDGRGGHRFEKKDRGGCSETRRFTFNIVGIDTMHVYQLASKSGASGDNIREILKKVVDQTNGIVAHWQMTLAIKQQLFRPSVNGRKIKTRKPVWTLDNDPEFSKAVRKRLGGAADMYLLGMAATKAASGSPQMQLSAAEFEDEADQAVDIHDFYEEEPDSGSSQSSQSNDQASPPPAPQKKRGGLHTLGEWSDAMRADSEFTDLAKKLLKIDGWSPDRIRKGLAAYFQEHPTASVAERKKLVISELAPLVEGQNAPTLQQQMNTGETNYGGTASGGSPFDAQPGSAANPEVIDNRDQQPIPPADQQGVDGLDDIERNFV